MYLLTHRGERVNGLVLPRKNFPTANRYLGVAFNWGFYGGFSALDALDFDVQRTRLVGVRYIQRTRLDYQSCALTALDSSVFSALDSNQFPRHRVEYTLLGDKPSHGSDVERVTVRVLFLGSASACRPCDQTQRAKILQSGGDLASCDRAVCGDAGITVVGFAPVIRFLGEELQDEFRGEAS